MVLSEPRIGQGPSLDTHTSARVVGLALVLIAIPGVSKDKHIHYVPYVGTNA